MNASVKAPSLKGPSMVIKPDEGEAYWQPKPSTGYIMAKITPDNSPYDDFSCGIQVLEPGSAVREHGHKQSHEMIFVYEGTGHCMIDGERHEIVPGTTLMLGRRVMHSIHNDGDTQMKMHWVMFPPGLEDWFRAIGRERTPGDANAPVFERPENVKDVQDRMRFMRPEDVEAG